LKIRSNGLDKLVCLIFLLLEDSLKWAGEIGLNDCPATPCSGLKAIPRVAVLVTRATPIP
jgi:hypothetical protein